MTGPATSAEYEVTALRYGTRTARRSEVFLHFEVYREPDRELAMDYFVWVARNADRTVLVDCGFNELSGARRNRTMLCSPVEALRQIGVDAAEVSQLIVTHAHYDHIGNLLSFPAARIVIVNSSSGRSGSTQVKWPRFILPEAYDSGFGLRLMLKDMRIALQLEQEAGVPAPLGRAAVAAWAAAAEDLPPTADHTEIVRWLAARIDQSRES